MYCLLVILMVSLSRIQGQEKCVCPTTPEPVEYPPCGYSQYEDSGIEGGSIPAPSIIGGWQARPHEFPYQVMLSIDKGSDSFLCGGSIIDKKYVITAAHCIHGAVAGNVTVILAEEDRSVNSGEEITMGVQEILGHESYDPEIIYNDIALLRLEGDGISRWTDNVQPICMPTAPTRDLVSEMTTTSGWGKTEKGVTSNLLMYTNTPVMGFHDCQSCYTDFFYDLHSIFLDLILDGNVCGGVCSTGTNTAKGACNGDSGGPMALKDADGLWHLTGIVSFGYDCFSTPTVYADPYFYLDWIREHTPDGEIDFGQGDEGDNSRREEIVEF